MHAILSYRGNRPTNSHTHKQTHRQGRLQYSAPLILARSVMMPLPGIPIHDLNWMRKDYAQFVSAGYARNGIWPVKLCAKTHC